MACWIIYIMNLSNLIIKSLAKVHEILATININETATCTFYWLKVYAFMEMFSHKFFSTALQKQLQNLHSRLGMGLSYEFHRW